MKRHERTPLGFYAEIEARRFSRAEYYELLSHWFPRTASFAAMRGGSLPAVVPQDPAMDVVGTFYALMGQEDKDRWEAFFNGEGTMVERAIGVGLTKQGLYDWMYRTMENLGDAFKVKFPEYTSQATAYA